MANGLPLNLSDYRLRVEDYGTCLKFNGSSGVINLGTANPFSGNFYLSLWVKWTGLNGSYQSLVAKRTSYGASTMMFDLVLLNTTGEVIFDTATDYFSTGVFLPQAKWVNLTWVHETGTFDKMYVDGDLLYTSGHTAQLGTDTTAPITVGADQSPAQQFFNGLIDRVVIGQSAPTQKGVIEMCRKGNYENTQMWTRLELNESSGGTVYDSSGNGNNGTISGPSFVTDGVTKTRTAAANRFAPRNMGTCLKYTGATTNSTLIKSGRIVSGQTDYSISAWINYKSNSGAVNDGNVIYSERAATGNNIFKLQFDTTANTRPRRVRLTIRDDANTLVRPYSTNDIFPNRWIHLVVTKRRLSASSQQVTFYINGVQDSQQNVTVTDTLTNSSTQCTIGADVVDTGTGGTNTFDGLIDELYLHGGVLTLDEVKSIYWNGQYPATGGLGLWRLDESSGTAVVDSLGLNSNGTISGATYSTGVFLKTRSSV